MDEMAVSVGATGAGGRVKLDGFVDQTLNGQGGTIQQTQLGLYAWLIVKVDDGRTVRVEPMDVIWPVSVERLDGSEVYVWTPDDAEPGQRVFCTCGMPDEYEVVDGNDCRSLGCDPLCPANGCVG
ncbi:MAG: hypothetical protein ACOYB2_10405 [Limnohabitans sp.]